jgi:hypothetical protein
LKDILTVVIGSPTLLLGSRPRLLGRHLCTLRFRLSLAFRHHATQIVGVVNVAREAVQCSRRVEQFEDVALDRRQRRDDQP